MNALHTETNSITNLCSEAHLNCFEFMGGLTQYEHSCCRNHFKGSTYTKEQRKTYIRTLTLSRIFMQWGVK